MRFLRRRARAVGRAAFERTAAEPRVLHLRPNGRWSHRWLRLFEPRRRAEMRGRLP